MVKQFVIPHRSDSLALLHPLLRTLLCTDVVTHICRGKRRTMVHSLWYGKDISIWRHNYSWSGRHQTIKTKNQETITLWQQRLINARTVNYVQNTKRVPSHSWDVSGAGISTSVQAGRHISNHLTKKHSKRFVRSTTLTNTDGLALFAP